MSVPKRDPAARMRALFGWADSKPQPSFLDDQPSGDETLKRAIRQAKGRNTPIELSIRQNKVDRSVSLTWNGGLRYPHLERLAAAASGLDSLYAPRSR